MATDPRVEAVRQALGGHLGITDPPAGQCCAEVVVAALDAYDAAACACGAPLALGVVHRRGAPCYLPPDEAELVEVKSLREREARVRAVCDAEWDWKAGRSLHAALRAAVDGEV